MKTLVAFLLVSLCLTHSLAQNKTLVLDTALFSTEQRFNLTTAEGWVYKGGHNPDWASPQLKMTGWVKRNPSTFSGKDADQSGRAEGWFRLKIQLDSTLKNMPLSLRKTSWAAVDIYLDGRLLESFGSTGALGKPYAEHNPFGELPVVIHMNPEQPHLLAIHVIDYTSPLSKSKLKSELDGGFHYLIGLIGPQTTANIKSKIKARYVFTTLWVALAVILTMLSWLLPFQNSHEKTIIRLLAIWGTLATIHNLGLFLQSFQIPFIVTFITFNIAWIIYYILGGLLLVVLFPILGRPLSNRLNWIISAFSLAEGVWCVYSESNLVGSIVNVLLFFIILYLLIASWENLKGAQWAIVVGSVLSLFFNLTFAIAVLNHFFNSNSAILNLLGFDTQSSLTGSLLSLPLAFITYITLRFREILIEVQQKAADVVHITEEKRQLLSDQNERLEQQVEARTAELKASQAQLIQKEKLASLGELTAGIAHEIQNPLNFVNNFAEVSTELIDELKQGPFQELPDSQKEYAGEILSDLTSNLRKINHHGGRASSIVKGMLEHSRTESGERRSTGLNALADEYLKIAYHGLRAKEKDFNCALVTDFDPDLAPVAVVPQEIGRVLLNLYNNAFYAVSEKQKTAPADYLPTVSISTQRSELGTEIRVKDNGMGIPESVKAKIFQPFFTTKPTGEGTGLGLSLSYDIITKGHGGTLTVDSTAGEGSEFIITLPIA